MGLWTFTLLVFAVNFPFGYWRASVRKSSARWLLALFLPVPLTVALGIYSCLGFKLTTALAVAVAYCLGQFVGGRVRNIIQGRGPGRSHG